MTHTEGVVVAFTAQGKGGRTGFAADQWHLLAAAGQNFMRICLMTHIPYQTVIRGIKDVMQGDGQLNNAQTRAEMSAGLANAVDQIFTQLSAQLR